jgi:hypothetical protein
LDSSIATFFASYAARVQPSVELNPGNYGGARVPHAAIWEDSPQSP